MSPSLIGSSIENEDNLRFAEHAGARSMIRARPLSEASKAYDRNARPV